MRKLIAILLLLPLFGCGYNNFDDYFMDDFPTESVSNMTVLDVRKIYDRSGVTTFSRDSRIEGTVIANDKSGNFYRTFIIADYTGAIEIKAGMYDLFTLYPIGKKINVSLKGMTCGADNGMLQLGLKSPKGSNYEIDYMGHQSVVDKYIERLGVVITPEVTRITIKNINDNMIGQLVMIESLTMNYGISTGWADDGRYTKDIVAKQNETDSIFIHTSEYADFAASATPSQRVNITGVIMKKGNDFRLKIRDLNDVEFNP